MPVYLRTLIISVGMLFVGCKVPSLDDLDAHLVPTYLCFGDGKPTAAVWDRPGGTKGRVRIYSAPNAEGNRHKFCEATLASEWCAFDRQPTDAENPLQLRFYQHHVTEQFRKNYTFHVLSGPVTTGTYHAQSVTAGEAGTVTVPVQVVEFVRCEDSPYGKKNTDKVCKTDAQGNPIDCYCPNEGGVYSTSIEQQSVTIPGKRSVQWVIDETWFSDRVQTRGYNYLQGSQALFFSGPGIAGSQDRNVNSGGVGNNAYPAGVYLGTPHLTSQIEWYTDEEGVPVPVGDHQMNLVVACAEAPPV